MNWVSQAPGWKVHVCTISCEYYLFVCSEWKWQQFKNGMSQTHVMDNLKDSADYGKEVWCEVFKYTQGI